jgi:4-hydroxybutyrate CoA-transferase
MDWRSAAMNPADALRHVTSGMKVFVHGAAATPTPLLDALADAPGIEGVRLYHLHTEGPCRFVDPSQEGRIFSVSLFTGAACRGPIAEGRADFVPVFLSDIPELFRSQRIPLDVALVQVSPPDKHGYCTLGTSVDAARAAVDSARIVIAEINERMPRTRGHSTVPLSRITAFTHSERPLPQRAPEPETDVEARIGALIADLIDDGSTLQLGIGGIPNAVLSRLGDKHDLGVHTEMFSDGVIDLALNGNITNARKKVHPGRLVTSFVNGSQRLYDFVDDNARVEFHPCDRTNDISIIRKNPKVVAVNSALQVDLTGQICADSIGHRIYSGIGGQMDFMHAAAYSEGGKPIIAIPSTAAGGKLSRIVAALEPGAGVVTTRGHVHWMVTEYGAVNLHGLTLRERGDALIRIAHPDFRGELARQLAEIRHFVLGK